jgi:hypothetical protein
MWFFAHELIYEARGIIDMGNAIFLPLHLPMHLMIMSLEIKRIKLLMPLDNITCDPWVPATKRQDHMSFDLK